MWAYILQFSVVTALLGKAELEEVVLFLSVGFLLQQMPVTSPTLKSKPHFPPYNHSISLISAPIFQAT